MHCLLAERKIIGRVFHSVCHLAVVYVRSVYICKSIDVHGDGTVKLETAIKSSHTVDIGIWYGKEFEVPVRSVRHSSANKCSKQD